MADLDRILGIDPVNTSPPSIIPPLGASLPEFQLHLPGPNWALPIDLNLVSDLRDAVSGDGNGVPHPAAAAGHMSQLNGDTAQLLNGAARGPRPEGAVRGPRPEGSPEIIINSPGIKVRSRI